MSPQEYNETLSAVVPSSVVLRAMHAQSTLTSFDGKFTPQPKIADKLNFNVVSGREAIFTHEYQAQIQDEEGDLLMIVQARYELRASCSHEVPHEFWDLYKTRQVLLYTRPYFRELVTSICARAFLITNPIRTHFVPATAQQPENSQGEEGAKSDQAMKRIRKRTQATDSGSVSTGSPKQSSTVQVRHTRKSNT